VSPGAVHNNALPEKLNIIDRKIIKDLSELHDKTINLNETFLYSVNDSHTEETGQEIAKHVRNSTNRIQIHD
jgi:hypothetical protein